LLDGLGVSADNEPHYIVAPS